MKSNFRIVFHSVLFGFMLAICVICMSSCTLVDNGEGSGVFGYHFIKVNDTKSMEPTFGSDDIIVVREYDSSELQVGEIISFWGFIDDNRTVITHRIYDVKTLDDGSVVYYTKGDNNELYDQDPMNIVRQSEVYPEDIIGVYVTRISG